MRNLIFSVIWRRGRAPPSGVAIRQPQRHRRRQRGPSPAPSRCLSAASSARGCSPAPSATRRSVAKVRRGPAAVAAAPPKRRTNGAPGDPEEWDGCRQARARGPLAEARPPGSQPACDGLPFWSFWPRGRDGLAERPTPLQSAPRARTKYACVYGRDGARWVAGAGAAAIGSGNARKRCASREDSLSLFLSIYLSISLSLSLSRSLARSLARSLSLTHTHVSGTKVRR